MGRSELVPQLPGRPATVVYEGWTVYVGVRDAAYLREKRAWRQRVRAVHPDRHPGEEKKRWQREFRVVNAKRLAWVMEECQWYAKLGLLPPDGATCHQRTANRRRRLKGLPPIGACSVGPRVG